MLPGKAGDPGRSGRDNRLFVEAVLWVARTGSPWRDLPQEFGGWNSVYQRFARWSRSGVCQRVFEQLALEADFEEVFIDSTIVRAHQHAAGAAKKRSPGPWAFARLAEQPAAAAAAACALFGAHDPAARQVRVDAVCHGNSSN